MQQFCLRALLILFLLSAKALLADELRVLSSMSPKLTDVYVEAFESIHPNTNVIVLSKNTNAAIDEVLGGNPRNFDVFWASSPEAFSVLDDKAKFLAQPNCKSEINTTAGYATFAYSGLGWSQKQDSLIRRPTSWQDLLSHDYQGRIGMASPSRSGTTHMLVEYFLQVEGWDAGWAYLLELSGNLSTITARSFGVPDGLMNNRFDIGLSIDFLAQSLEPDLSFTYGKPVVILPAQIGILSNSKSETLSCAFMDFILSDDGQRLLFDPSIKRIPAQKHIRSNTQAINPEIEAAIETETASYLSSVAQSRYWAVNAIFDIFIVENLSKRRILWSRLNALPESAQKVQAKELLSTIGLTESSAQSVELNSTPFQVSNFALNSSVQNQMIEEWRKIAGDKLAKTEEIIVFLESSSH